MIGVLLASSIIQSAKDVIAIPMECSLKYATVLGSACASLGWRGNIVTSVTKATIPFLAVLSATVICLVLLTHLVVLVVNVSVALTTPGKHVMNVHLISTVTPHACLANVQLKARFRVHATL